MVCSCHLILLLTLHLLYTVLGSYSLFFVAIHSCQSHLVSFNWTRKPDMVEAFYLGQNLESC